MWGWSKNDLVRSTITAVFVAVVAVLYSLTTQHGFDLFATNWGEVGKMVINAAFITFVGRMGEKFVTNKDGKVFGRIG